MKLIIAIVQNSDADSVNNALVKENFKITKLGSTGGFLNEGNTTFMVGVEPALVEKVVAVIKANTLEREKVSSVPGGFYPVTTIVGGATIFVLDAEQK